jgi:aspartate/methionine/tyrosine aminotransferase
MPYPRLLARWLIRTGLARFLPSVRRLVGDGSPFLRYYSNRVLAAPHAALLDAAVLLQAPGPDVIDLSLGAPRLDLVPSGSTRLPADRRGWPPAGGLPELRAAIAAKLRRDSGQSVHPDDEVLVTLGAAGAFRVAIDTFVNPGDRVVLLDPSSPLYSVTLRHHRARIRWLTTWTEDGRTRFKLDELSKLLRGARMIVVASPGNPTGGLVAAEDLEQIAWWADKRDVLIYSDEVFERYHYEGERVTVATLPRGHQRTITAGSVSKGHGLAAARVGWLAGHRHLVRPCALTAGAQCLFVPTLSQQVALTALEQDEGVFDPIRAEFASRRRYAFERLRAAGLNPPWPAGGFFFWVPVWEIGLSGRAFSERLLRSCKVLVTPGDLFGPSGSGYVRLSYAVEDGRLREGLSRLADFVRGLRGEERPPLRQAA